VQDHDETGFGGEVQNAIERGIGEARGFTRNLRRDELLVDAELADAGEDAGECLEHAADVVDAVHVGRIESGDHRIEPRLRLSGERAVDAGDVGVGERVVVERRVGVQVVGRCEVTRVRVRPLLLQRDTEQRRSSHARAHDLEEVRRLDPLLDVVRQMEVRVAELVGGTLILRRADARGRRRVPAAAARGRR
jgi:hypothetical protein